MGKRNDHYVQIHIHKNVLRNVRKERIGVRLELI